MNFSCDNCQRRYSIADDKVRGKTVKIRCKNCQNVITVAGPAFEPEPELEIPEEDRTRMVPLEQIEKIRASSLTEIPAAVAPTPAMAPKDPWEDEPTRTAPPLDPQAQWFAMVKGKQVGPLDGNALVQRSASGDINPRTYMWKQGMTDWKRAADIPELATVLAGASAPPPPPPSQAPRAEPRTWQEPAPSLEEEQPTRMTAGAGRGAAHSEQEQDQAYTDQEHTVGGDPYGGEPEEPRQEAPRAASASPADLFSDLELDRGQGDEANDEQTAAGTSPGVASSRDGKDPFASIGSLDPKSLPKPSESTAHFIAKSGVKNRNPPWKIATFVVLAIALPVGVLYLLSELKVVPLEVTRVNDQGQQVKESVFSAEGVSGLRDLLLGRKPPAPAPTPPVRSTSTQPKEKSPPQEKPKAVSAQSSQDLADLYKDDKKTDVGPRVRPSESGSTPAVASATANGPKDGDVAKVVEQNHKAFQGCIEAEMKKNPGFKGGKVTLITTIGSTGVVKKVSIDRHEIDVSSLGECLKARAKRMTFASFSGDDVDVEVPLILSATM